jgi:hypothetical protein
MFERAIPNERAWLVVIPITALLIVATVQQVKRMKGSSSRESASVSLSPVVGFALIAIALLLAVALVGKVW